MKVLPYTTLYKVFFICLFCFQAKAQKIINNDLQQKQLVPIVVGSTKILIPTPLGFGLVTPEMTATYEYQSQFISNKGNQHAFFIPDSQVVLARKKDFVPLPMRKSIRVQTLKMLETKLPYPTSELYIQYKKYIKESYLKAIPNIKDINGQIEERSEEIATLLKYDPKLNLVQSLSLKGYTETSNSFTYSTFSKVASENATTKELETNIVTCTYSSIHVKDKIIFVYVYGDEKDLELTRSISNKMVQDIFRANSLAKAAPAIKRK